MPSKPRERHPNARDPRRDPKTGQFGRRYRAWTITAARDPERAVREMREALSETEGNLARAAHRLGVSRHALYRWLPVLPGGWEAVNSARIARYRKNLHDPLRIG